MVDRDERCNQLRSAVAGHHDRSGVGRHAIYTLLAAERKELSFTIMPVRTSLASLAQLVAQALEATPRHLTPLVSLSVVSIAWGIEAVPSQIGRQIAELVQQRDGFLFLNASHAVGQLPIDMKALACDVLVFPARKWLRGPKGVAVLCVSDRALERLGAANSTDAAGARWSGRNLAQPLGDARRFEGYESNPGLHLAFKAACDYALALGVDRIAAQNKIVRSSVMNRLAERLGWQTLEGNASKATALMTYRVPKATGKQLLQDFLWNAGVNVSVL